MRPAWLEIKLNALRRNVRNLKSCVANRAGFMAVVKADAYGHGAPKVCEVLRDEGITRFAVVTTEEGIELREGGIDGPILILGHTPQEDHEQVVRYDLTPMTDSLSHARSLNTKARQLGRKVPVHIKVDTGMGRFGFLPGTRAAEEILAIAGLDHIYVEGIFTHLATADQPSGEFVWTQFRRFQAFVSHLEERGLRIPIKHVANSAATIALPEMHLDMVRPGTSLYGLYPGAKIAADSKILLYPVMEAKAKLVHIKTVPGHTPISYGGTFVTRRESVIGVVPMGYVDGVFRLLANSGEVLVRGKRCPIVGTICMDHFMVDVTDVPGVQYGDEVVLFGAQNGNTITADEVAARMGTISIEVVTRMGKRMRRVYCGREGG